MFWGYDVNARLKIKGRSMPGDDDNSVLDTAKALNIGGVLPELYKDAVSPAAKEVGKGLQTVAKAVNIALRPVAGLVWGYDKIEHYIINELPKKLNNRNVENIVAPEPHLAAPLLESLRYTGYKDSLREMYLNLLATSMDKDTAKKAHPSFVEIIRQLSSDEAKLLSYFRQRKGYPEIVHSCVPRKIWRHEVYSGIKQRFEKICENSEVDMPELYLSYLDNLARLKLIDFIQAIGESRLNSRYDNLEIEQETIEYLFVTNLGQQFIDACLDEVGNG